MNLETAITLVRLHVRRLNYMGVRGVITYGFLRLLPPRVAAVSLFVGRFSLEATERLCVMWNFCGAVPGLIAALQRGCSAVASFSAVITCRLRICVDVNNASSENGGVFKLFGEV